MSTSPTVSTTPPCARTTRSRRSRSSGLPSCWPSGASEDRRRRPAAGRRRRQEVAGQEGDHQEGDREEGDREEGVREEVLISRPVSWGLGGLGRLGGIAASRIGRGRLGRRRRRRRLGHQREDALVERVVEGRRVVDQSLVAAGLDRGGVRRHALVEVVVGQRRVVDVAEGGAGGGGVDRLGGLGGVTGSAGSVGSWGPSASGRWGPRGRRRRVGGVRRCWARAWAWASGVGAGVGEGVGSSGPFGSRGSFGPRGPSGLRGSAGGAGIGHPLGSRSRVPSRPGVASRSRGPTGGRSKPRARTASVEKAAGAARPLVGTHHAQDQVDVGVAVVVAVHRGATAVVGGEVLAARAEVDGRGQGGVVDVLGVAAAVAVGVDADHRPGGRDELHRSDRAVEPLSPSSRPRVGVAQPGGLVAAVEPGAQDGRLARRPWRSAASRRADRGRTRPVRRRRRAPRRSGSRGRRWRAPMRRAGRRPARRSGCRRASRHRRRRCRGRAVTGPTDSVGRETLAGCDRGAAGAAACGGGRGRGGGGLRVAGGVGPHPGEQGERQQGHRATHVGRRPLSPSDPSFPRGRADPPGSHPEPHHHHRMVDCFQGAEVDNSYLRGTTVAPLWVRRAPDDDGRCHLVASSPRDRPGHPGLVLLDRSPP